MSHSVGSVSGREIKPLTASFKSPWDKFNLAQKIGAGVLFALLIPITIFWGCGGFRKTLHVYDPSRNGPIDTNLRPSDLARLLNVTSESSEPEQTTMRSMAMKVLLQTKASQLPFLEHLEIAELTRAMVKLGNGDEDVIEYLEAVHDISMNRQIDPATEESINKWTDDQNRGSVTVAAVGVFEKKRPVGNADNGNPGLTGEELVRNLVADMVCPISPTASHMTDGARLKTLIEAHSAAVEAIILDTNLLANAKIPAKVAAEIDFAIKGAAYLLCRQDETLYHLTCEKQSNDKTKSFAADVAKSLTAEQAEDIATAIEANIDDPSFKEFDRAQLAKFNAGSKAGAMEMFLANVLPTYFDSQKAPDRRAMIASMFRETKPGDSRERQLIGLVKGAGPYLLAMLQSFGHKATGALSTELEELTKSLTPIPDDIKRAMLADIVRNSNGKLTKINDLRSLSTTPIGETMSATIFSKDSTGQETSQQVVIKLLRPGIRERAARERPVLLQELAKIDGIAVDFKATVDRLDKKMDLKLQAATVQRAPVSDTKTSDVTTMKLANGIDSTDRVLVLQKAPGSTVERWLEFLHDHKGQDPSAEQARPDGAGTVTPVKVADTLALALESTQTWVKEAFFGSGFHRGDLHSSHMIVSTDSSVPDGASLLTLIGMENVIESTPGQRQAIVRLYDASNEQNSAKFIDAFKMLLSPAEKHSMEMRHWTREAFKKAVGEIMEAETLGQTDRTIDQLNSHSFENDYAPDEDSFLENDGLIEGSSEKQMNPELRVEQCMKAAKVLELGIPAAIADFSRSQMLLRHAIKTVKDINVANTAALKAAFERF